MNPDALPFVVSVIIAFAVLALAIAFGQFATGPAMRRGAHGGRHARAGQRPHARSTVLGRG